MRFASMAFTFKLEVCATCKRFIFKINAGDVFTVVIAVG